MSDLVGNHIVGFPTRRLISVLHDLKRSFLSMLENVMIGKLIFSIPFDIGKIYYCFALPSKCTFIGARKPPFKLDDTVVKMHITA